MTALTNIKKVYSKLFFFLKSLKGGNRMSNGNANSSFVLYLLQIQLIVWLGLELLTYLIGCIYVTTLSC